MLALRTTPRRTRWTVRMTPCIECTGYRAYELSRLREELPALFFGGRAYKRLPYMLELDQHLVVITGNTVMVPGDGCGSVSRVTQLCRSSPGDTVLEQCPQQQLTLVNYGV